MDNSNIWSPIAWAISASLVLVSSLVLVVTSDDVPATSKRQESIYHLLRGYRWAHREMHPEAIDAFTKAIEILPALPEPHHSLGWSYIASGIPEKALVAFQEASRSSPLDSVPVSSIGYSYLLQGRYAEALEQFERAMEMDPTNWDAKKGFAWSKFHLGLPQEAEPVFREVLALRPALIDGYLGLADSYFALNRDREAEAMYLSAIGVREDIAHIHSQLGWIKLRESSNYVHESQTRTVYALAERHFQEALRYEPNFQPALDGLGTLRSMQNGAGQ